MKNTSRKLVFVIFFIRKKRTDDLITSSFMAVPMTFLSAISMRAGLFASAEIGQEADHQQGTDHSFEIFHGDIELRREGF